MLLKPNLTKLWVLLLTMIIVLVACGGGDAGTDRGDADSQQADAPATATPFPTFEFVAPTNPPAFNQSVEETEEASDSDAEMAIELDPTKVERGLGRYEALECATCHGEGGIGTDEAGALLEFALSEDDFITFMRSGGELGNDHQFSTDRLSQNGATNLYQYLVSLTQGE